MYSSVYGIDHQPSWKRGHGLGECYCYYYLNRHVQPGSSVEECQNLDTTLSVSGSALWCRVLLRYVWPLFFFVILCVCVCLYVCLPPVECCLSVRIRRQPATTHTNTNEQTQTAGHAERLTRFVTHARNKSTLVHLHQHQHQQQSQLQGVKPCSRPSLPPSLVPTIAGSNTPSWKSPSPRALSKSSWRRAFGESINRIMCQSANGRILAHLAVPCPIFVRVCVWFTRRDTVPFNMASRMGRTTLRHFPVIFAHTPLLLRTPPSLLFLSLSLCVCITVAVPRLPMDSSCQTSMKGHPR